MSALFDTMADEKPVGKDEVVYQECKVIDGEAFLINVCDNAVKQAFTFQAFSTETTEIFPCEWEYEEFNKVFRFNAELMNPNKREGRYHWIIERLTFCSDGKGGRKLVQQPDPTEAIAQRPIREYGVKIPTGRLNYAERAKLRDDMDRLERTRNENIRTKREATRERFLRWVESVRDDVRRKREERARVIAQERAERLAAQVEKRRQEEEERLRLQALDDQRETRIHARDESRRKQWNAGIQELLEEGRLETEQRQAAVAFAEAQKKTADDLAREQARLERERLEGLDEKRQQNFDERQHRQWKKGQAWLLKREGTLKDMARDQEVSDQRRVGLQHRCNLARSKAYQAYLEKKADRDRVLSLEKAFERVDTPAANDDILAQQAVDAKERSASRMASETAARQKLEEHRRLAKLDRMREKSTGLAEKRRNDSELTRHEKYVDNTAKKEVDEKAATADKVRAFKERDMVVQSATARKANERTRLDKLRSENIQRRQAEKGSII